MTQQLLENQKTNLITYERLQKANQEKRDKALARQTVEREKFETLYIDELRRLEEMQKNLPLPSAKIPGEWRKQDLENYSTWMAINKERVGEVVDEAAVEKSIMKKATLKAKPITDAITLQGNDLKDTFTNLLSGVDATGKTYTIVDQLNTLGLTATNQLNELVRIGNLNDKQAKQLQHVIKNLVQGATRDTVFQTAATTALQDIIAELKKVSGATGQNPAFQADVQRLLGSINTELTTRGLPPATPAPSTSTPSTSTPSDTSAPSTSAAPSAPPGYVTVPRYEEEQLSRDITHMFQHEVDLQDPVLDQRKDLKNVYHLLVYLRDEMQKGKQINEEDLLFLKGNLHLLIPEVKNVGGTKGVVYPAENLVEYFLQVLERNFPHHEEIEIPPSPSPLTPFPIGKGKAKLQPPVTPSPKTKSISDSPSVFYTPAQPSFSTPGEQRMSLKPTLTPKEMQDLQIDIAAKKRLRVTPGFQRMSKEETNELLQQYRAELEAERYQQGTGVKVMKRKRRSRDIQGDGMTYEGFLHPHDRLKLLVAARETGNDSQELANEGMELIDWMLKNKWLTPKQHRELFNFFKL